MTTNDNKIIKIGAITDVHSRIGREEKTALDIAVERFNNNDSNNHKLSLSIQDSGRNPFVVATAAQKLIEEKKVEVIVGLETWEEPVLVGDVGGRAQVPVLSFVAPVITLPLATTRWPFLALQHAGSEIEHRLVLLPFSSLSNSNTNEVVQGEESGLVGTDSAWIVRETISSYLDSFNSSVISSMEGTLGIKTYYSEDTSLYRRFCPKFRTTFRNEYYEEDNFHPGLNALRAYDSIGIIMQAMEESKSDESSSNALLKKIISSQFTGVNGEICLKEGKLSHDPILRIVNVVGKKYKDLDFCGVLSAAKSTRSDRKNAAKTPAIPVPLTLTAFENKNVVIAGEVVRLKTTPKAMMAGTVRFNGSFGLQIERRQQSINREAEQQWVTWLGDPKQGVPKGWAMPTDKKHMIIGVSARTSFEKFVKVEDGKHPGEKHYDGF
ncbi:Apoptosis inhibitory protein 5 isoform 1 [Hibiscus syriacus]|uniref:Apoptosis inhibitory protein 5 isoform 1 n=1 Tax=Hibiscus syriacus TaxID=106335 RepID=A0A6A3CZ71_HIBSY|nr:Apoptosis inhibitory protein 5 isoform 1 [Hibiscus syriacus]